MRNSGNYAEAEGADWKVKVKVVSKCGPTEEKSSRKEAVLPPGSILPPHRSAASIASRRSDYSNAIVTSAHAQEMQKRLNEEESVAFCYCYCYL
jgi:hypothetical protein